MPDNIQNPDEPGVSPENPENPVNKNEPDKRDDLTSAETNPETVKDDKSAAFPLPLASRVKESNYQISLIDENLLKVVVTTKKAVRIESGMSDESNLEQIQSNEIYFYPSFEYGIQEVEALISIEQEENIQNTGEESDDAPPEEIEKTPKSNFNINLINENLLKIRIETKNGIRIDSGARDKKFSAHTQSNKIYLKPKSHGEVQKIEITIEIEAQPLKSGSESTDEGKVKLVPNPEVVDLIQSPDYSALYNDEVADAGGYKNPFDALRKLIRKNITIGIIVAVALHITAAAVAFYALGKKSKEPGPDEQSRLIVIQDLPDPKIKLEDIEDPNRPKQETPPVTGDKIVEPKREFPPKRVIRPPTVNRPKEEEENKDTSLASDLGKELDSLRKLIDQTDSLLAKSDTGASTFEIPDSLRNNFSEKDIGLAMYFPKNWKLTDQRDINKNETQFKGVVITDTTAEQPGTMTLFIFLDNDNKDFNTEDFKTEFKMNDSTLTAFVKEPKTLAGFTEYRFYIFNKLGTEKLSLRASVRKQFFDQYKNEIEAVVRSISIHKKPEPQDSSDSGK